MPDWEAILTQALLKDLREALRQLAADELYHRHAPTVQETVDALNLLGELAEQLSNNIGCLSDVALAALHEEGFEHARYELPKLKPILIRLKDAAPTASERVKNEYSRIEGEGQGAGSARGRTKDLAAIALSWGDKDVWPPARAPSHKFGARVIYALLAHQEEPRARSRGELASILSWLWNSYFEGEAPSWSVTLKNRHTLSDQARQRLERRAMIKERISLGRIDLPEKPEDGSP